MDAFHAVIITHKRINSPEIELMEIVVIIRFSKSSVSSSSTYQNYQINLLIPFYRYLYDSDL